jgi:hypothetical protein
MCRPKDGRKAGYCKSCKRLHDRITRAKAACGQAVKARRSARDCAARALEPGSLDSARSSFPDSEAIVILLFLALTRTPHGLVLESAHRNLKVAPEQRRANLLHTCWQRLSRLQLWPRLNALCCKCVFCCGCGACWLVAPDYFAPTWVLWVVSTSLRSVRISDVPRLWLCKSKARHEAWVSVYVASVTVMSRKTSRHACLLATAALLFVQYYLP